MDYFDYPEEHLMRYIGKIIFCHERGTESKLLEFAKNGSAENTMPLHFSNQQKEDVLAWKKVFSSRIYFKCLIKLNMNDVEHPEYHMSDREIKNIFRFAKDDTAFTGFNLDELCNDGLNRRRLELYHHVEAGKIVFCDLYVIVKIHKGLRKMEKDKKSDSAFWEAVKSKHEFTILDPNDPALEARKEVVEEALAAGKKVKLNGYSEVIYRQDLKKYQIKYSHLSGDNSDLFILPLEKIVYRDEAIEVFD